MVIGVHLRERKVPKVRTIREMSSRKEVSKVRGRGEGDRVVPLDDGGTVAGLHAGVLRGRLGSCRCHFGFGSKVMARCGNCGEEEVSRGRSVAGCGVRTLFQKTR